MKDDDFDTPYDHLLFAQKSGARRSFDFASAIIVIAVIAVSVAFVVHGVYALVCALVHCGNIPS